MINCVCAVAGCGSAFCIAPLAWAKPRPAATAPAWLMKFWARDALALMSPLASRNVSRSAKAVAPLAMLYPNAFPRFKFLSVAFNDIF